MNVLGIEFQSAIESSGIGMTFTLTTVRATGVNLVEVHTDTIKSAQYAGSKRYQNLHQNDSSPKNLTVVFLPLTRTFESVYRQTAYSVIFEHLKQQARKAIKLCVAKRWATGTIGLAWILPRGISALFPSTK